VRFPTPPLLLVTDRHQARVPLEDLLAAAFSVGCRWASIREKDLPADAQIALAHRLLPLARQHGATLTLHGDPALAKAADVDGVHLAMGCDAAAGRTMLGKDALIGISIHTAEEAATLDRDIFDYAIAGPAYDTVSKPGYGPFLGAIGIQAICQAAPVPVVAIGGITAEAVAEIRAAGAAGIAVMGGVMRAARPAAEVQRLLAALS
jgi:thiamine-phosphate pyrophosphorylase